ncbi:MAG: DMT family protein [Armatimonadetes bacterium]|nr:DMT family protein [Armatimonadota bacterium]MBS1711519.1 DMT family protein [Armatimonadota bacterium]MBX3107556.1 DMT family protein [Fimbriimonadaceae bacterium]
MPKKFFATVALLAVANVFMNLAWYGHLKFKDKPMAIFILASWGIALVEYCFQVPANRMGAEVMSVTQLKVTQELLSISTFALFAVFMFKEKPTMNHLISFLLLVGAAYFAAKK